MSELRWNPMLSEWVITATHRQDRTFFPPPGYNPLAPTAPGGFPTEIPASAYEIAVFDNKFPSLRPEPGQPAVESIGEFKTLPARGDCEVVCYTPRADAELAELPLRKVEELIYVWADRFDALAARDYVKYVYIFENKGREIGVTLPHPHGQIYAYPFVPPTAQREIDASRAHFERTGRDLLGDLLSQELSDGRRVVYENGEFVAVVPFYARYPFEVHIIPRRCCPAISGFDDRERRALAQALKVVMEKYNSLWKRSMPYIMLMHQRPTDLGADAYSWMRFHVEFYPPYRTPDKLKFLAGSEAGAGVFINDTLAEDSARQLREAAAQSA